LLPLIGEVDDVHAALSDYESVFDNSLTQLWHAKLGLQQTLPHDQELIASLLLILQHNRIDFTYFFRHLADLRCEENAEPTTLRDLFLDRPAFDAWAAQYRSRLQQENSQDEERKQRMQAVNPKYVLRNYLAQVAIEKAQKKDFSEVEKLLTILQHPFDEQPEHDAYAALPPTWASSLEVSCSS